MRALTVQKKYRTRKTSLKTRSHANFYFKSMQDFHGCDTTVSLVSEMHVYQILFMEISQSVFIGMNKTREVVRGIVESSQNWREFYLLTLNVNQDSIGDMCEMHVSL